MSSPVIPIRRRRRSEFEAAEDDVYSVLDERSRLSDSGSSKRTRTRESTASSISESHEPVLPRNYRDRNGMSQNDTDGDLDDGASDSLAANDEYQAGAIVRVKVTNFVTYEEAEFHPGPNLNMVIGPNGTGKSSLVCAICLGLGYGPSHLGRAQKVGEFVKHGKDDATIEIELQRRRADAHNPIIKVRITRDGDKRKWWINNRETSLKAVQTLTRELGIQVDNLCQFLPQDRVAEFAGLNPVELLHHTQRAAAPEEMLAWHEQLKSLRKEEKALQLQHETDQEALKNQMARQENLRADVERLKERQQILERVSLLEKTVPFIEYAEARKQHYHHKERKQEAQRRLKGLERQVEPTMRAVNAKQHYQSQIEAVVTERKKDVEVAERGADTVLKKIDDVDAEITQILQTRRAEIEGNKKRKQDLDRMRAKIRDMEARLQNAPPIFDSESWNSRIVSYQFLSNQCVEA
jgi:structural maintenance of chromosomes protein 5